MFLQATVFTRVKLEGRAGGDVPCELGVFPRRLAAGVK